MNKVSRPKKMRKIREATNRSRLSIGKAGVSSKEQDKKKKKTISKNQQ